MADVPGWNSRKRRDIDSAGLFLSSYQNFVKALDSKNSPHPSPPESYTILSLSRRYPLPKFPSNFPQAKRIPNTRFVVDGFRSTGPFSVAYFLTHFHADHYAGLTPHWARGLIFCSEVTARLLVECLKISETLVVPLTVGEIVQIDDCEVTLIEANHCPGAVQILFRVYTEDGEIEKYVHTGDMRYSPNMKLEPALCEFIGADAVYLDTTYCNPKFVFPSQEESVEYVANTVYRIMREQNDTIEINGEKVQKKSSVLFLISAYVVGKEKILTAVSRRCNCRVYVDETKLSILKCLDLADVAEVFTVDSAASNVHVVSWNVLGETWPYFRPNWGNMERIMRERGYSRVVGFVPTGWMYEVQKYSFPVRVKGCFEVHLVPYSEHSSYDELREYVEFLRPKGIVPTVGLEGLGLDSKQAASMMKYFANLVDETAQKRRFLKGFNRKAVTAQPTKAQDVEEEGSEEPDNNEGQTIVEMVTVCQEVPIQVVGGQSAKTVNVMDEAIEELKTCLPEWVTADQMIDLLTQSQGDITSAVSEFYERETEFRKQVATNAQSNSPGNDGLITGKFAPDHVSQQVNSMSNASIASGKVVFALAAADSMGLRAPNAHPSSANRIMKSTGKKRPPTRSTQSRITDWTIDSKSNKKPKFSIKSAPNKSKQSSITNFFRRAVVEDGAQDVDLGISSPQCAGKVSVGPQSGGLEIACKFKGTKHMYSEKLPQFLQILDSNVSKEDALVLLEKAKGDVNTALDLYYSTYNELSVKETGRQEAGSYECISSVQTGSNLINCDSRENASGNTAEVTALSIKKLSEASTVDAKASSVALPFEKYNPVEHACWCAGESAPYLHLARTFDLVEQESGKLKTTVMLCNMFRSLLSLSPEDVLPTIYLCTNRIAPDYENVDLNLGGSTVLAAIEDSFGTQKSKLREMYNSMGDLGDVAQACRQTQSLLTIPRPLLIHQVFTALQQISKEGGSGSSVRKKGVILSLLRSCREKETKFIVRTLVRNMRIGAMMRTVLPALAQAVILNSSAVCLEEGVSENLRTQLQQASIAAMEAYNILPNLNILVPTIMNKGIDLLSTTISISPGVPIKPMLAKITNGVPEVLKRFQGKAFTCEYKYDGQRAQVHMLTDGTIRIFSRNLEDSTSRFPDVIEIILSSIKSTTKNFVLDAEVVAIDRHNGNRIMAFQHLASRERGRNGSSIQFQNIKVDVCVFIFDLMFANGEQLVALPLRERRKRLAELFCDTKPGYLGFANQITVEDDEAYPSSTLTMNKVDEFLAESISSSCEGIMVKALDDSSEYAPSKRSDSWLKVKRDYVEGLHETLDLVPIGAWHGNGRKAGWFSPFLLACYDPDSEEYQSVCRVMSGFSDAFYKEMLEFFSGERILDKKPAYYRTLEEPDLWFSPELVWEIRGADLTVSPVHQAALGLVHPSRGISMRFPRFIRQRIDKKPEDGSTPTDIADLFNHQTRKMDFGIDDQNP